MSRRPNGAFAVTLKAITEGCATSADLADELGISVRQARSRLWWLQRRGEIRVAGRQPQESPRGGRPTLIYEACL